MIFKWLLQVLIGLFLCLGPTLAAADQADDTLALFTRDKYPETAKGIEAVVSGGFKTAPQILEALSDRRLLFNPDDHKVYFKDAAETLFDAKSGDKAAGVNVDSLKLVRVNNALRRSIEAAAGNLSILSPDPAKRRAAADSMFRSRNPDDLKKIETALAKETDPRLRQAFEQARAAIVAGKSDATEAQKIDAIRVLRARGDQDSLGPLGQISSASSGRVKVAADDAIAAIKFSQTIWSAVQNAYYGLSLGSVLLLAATGLAITFGVMGVINMAHGELVMIGAYTTFAVQELIRDNLPTLSAYTLVFAVPAAFLVSGSAGIVIERLVIRFLYGRPLETLLATWGVSLVLQQLVRTAFGPDNQKVASPGWMSGSFPLGGLDITYNRMWIIVFTIAVFFALQALLRATPFGLRMRAVTQNRRMASAMGINTGRMDALAFGLGSGIAGIAGVALSQIDNVSPNLGQGYIIDSFLVVVFGGVGNLWGTLVAALTLGVGNKFLEPIINSVLAKIAVLVFVILFIQKRPRGLFPLKGRAVEA